MLFYSIVVAAGVSRLSDFRAVSCPAGLGGDSGRAHLSGVQAADATIPDRERAALSQPSGVTLLLIVPMIFVLSAFVKQAVDAVHSVQLGVELGRLCLGQSLVERVANRFPGLIPSDLGALVQQLCGAGGGIRGRTRAGPFSGTRRRSWWM